MKVLVIGGTRNLGHFLVHLLVSLGHHVTVFNRGKTRDELPAEVERLHGDRSDSEQLRRALHGRTFDVVVDNALYEADEARAVVELLNGRTGHYIFISSGQVYLVREDIHRPFREDAYAGRLIPPPKPNTYGYEEWTYGIQKRQAEDVLQAAWVEHGFPYTALRLPMVNSERDHHNRLYGYLLRVQDGGPILAPSTPNYPLRHVYAADVVRAIRLLIETGKGKGEAYNISQNETFTLDAFLALLGEIVGVETRVVRIKRDLMEANGLLPDAAPFSDRWMSELDNQRSKRDLGLVYTPTRVYLERLVDFYREHPPTTPIGYRRRRSELLLVEQLREGIAS